MSTTPEIQLHNGNGAQIARQSDVTARRDERAEIMDAVIGTGDLSKLSAGERTEYYRATCHSTGLNPLTQPFEYIILNGKMRLYAKKDATDQLRKLNGVSIVRLEKQRDGDSYEVTAYAQTADGRTDTSLGAVYLKGLSGEAYSNALMKAETKAKRRVTLSICGLGWLDESEVESVPNARVGAVDVATGEIIRHAPPPPHPKSSPQIGESVGSVDALKAERREKVERLVSLMQTLPAEERSKILDQIEAKHGVRNVKLLDLAVLDELHDKIQAKYFGGGDAAEPAAAVAAPEAEEDPFADAPALPTVAEAAAPGHGKS